MSRWVSGSTLQELMQNACSRKAVRLAGKWLRQFHVTDYILPRAFYSCNKLRWLNILVQSTLLWLPEKDHGPYMKSVQDVASLTSSIPWIYRPVYLHGDISPSNLLITDKGVVGIDLLGCNLGMCWREVARMTVHLDITSYSSGQCHEHACLLRQEFLAGYGATTRQDIRRLSLFESLELLRRWRAEARSERPRLRRVRLLRELLEQRCIGVSVSSNKDHFLL